MESMAAAGEARSQMQEVCGALSGTAEVMIGSVAKVVVCAGGGWREGKLSRKGEGDQASMRCHRLAVFWGTQRTGSIYLGRALS